MKTEIIAVDQPKTGHSDAIGETGFWRWSPKFGQCDTLRVSITQLSGFSRYRYQVKTFTKPES